MKISHRFFPNPPDRTTGQGDFFFHISGYDRVSPLAVPRVVTQRSSDDCRQRTDGDWRYVDIHWRYVDWTLAVHGRWLAVSGRADPAPTEGRNADETACVGAGSARPCTAGYCPAIADCHPIAVIHYPQNHRTAFPNSPAAFRNPSSAPAGNYPYLYQKLS